MEYTRYFEGLQRDFWNAENKKVPARASKQPGINPRSEINWTNGDEKSLEMPRTEMMQIPKKTNHNMIAHIKHPHSTWGREA